MCKSRWAGGRQAGGRPAPVASQESLPLPRETGSPVALPAGLLHALLLPLCPVCRLPGTVAHFLTRTGTWLGCAKLPGQEPDVAAGVQLWVDPV